MEGTIMVSLPDIPTQPYTTQSIRAQNGWSFDLSKALNTVAHHTLLQDVFWYADFHNHQKIDLTTYEGEGAT